MKTLTKKTEILIAAFFFSILLNAQTPAIEANGNLKNQNAKKLNSSAIGYEKSKSDKSKSGIENLKTYNKTKNSFDSQLEFEINSITQQISETVKFRLDSKNINESGNEYDENLNAITEEIGRGIKYQPISSL